MEKRPFIIDCDTGTDDAIAILAALGSDAIRVRALTSVNGNVNENFTSRNNRDLVGYLGVDVEVEETGTTFEENSLLFHSQRKRLRS